MNLNMTSGRNPKVDKLKRMLEIMYSHELPFDGEFYQERSTWPRLSKVKIPAYFGSGWNMTELHLRGVFEGYNNTGDIPKRALIGPRPWPLRPWAGFHYEMLRWYDHWLKGMDTRVMEGAPIQIYVQGENPGLNHSGAGTWRAEKEWPLKRTQWRELYLGGPKSGLQGTLSDSAGAEQTRVLESDASTREAYLGEPRLVYRSEPMAQAMEITGPSALYLQASSSATDTDWLVSMFDEAPDGSKHELSKGWLRASHRKIDPQKSTPAQPYHPHLAAEPLERGQVYEFPIEIWTISNVFKPGHRIRMELANHDSVIAASGRPHVTIRNKATNTIYEGGRKASRLLVPVIPR
jgi:uncharacterized protein